MSPPVAARFLGYAGLIPFIGLALASAIGADPFADQARLGVVLYGGAILSFMGGCRWGFSAAGLGDGPRWAPLAISVTPALVAWVGLWLAPSAGLSWSAAIIIAGLIALYVDDVRVESEGGAPAWWTSLRLPLTIGACLALTLAALTGASHS